jgi:hypothetical protein
MELCQFGRGCNSVHKEVTPALEPENGANEANSGMNVRFCAETTSEPFFACLQAQNEAKNSIVAKRMTIGAKIASRQCLGARTKPIRSTGVVPCNARNDVSQPIGWQATAMRRLGAKKLFSRGSRSWE